MGFCAGCQEALPPLRRQGNPRKWCSAACKARTIRNGTGKVRERRCAWCQAAFIPGRSDQAYCQPRCNIRARDARKPRVEVPTRRCETCDSSFTPTANNALKAKYCSVRCQNRVHQLRYRALKAAATTERFRLRDVFERDGWVCQICAEPIDRDAKAPVPWSKSIDHRTPLARGGAHSFDNCQAAHLWCNSAKKDTDLSFVGGRG